MSVGNDVSGTAWPTDGPPPAVDVVVVSYNSAGELRGAVTPLVGREGINVIVVDNASQDGSLSSIADLDLMTLRRETNDGFAAGCNAGWRAGSARQVCFLNPDATLDADSLLALAAQLARDSTLGAVAPRIEEADGSLSYSLRRFPSVRATFARALFLHRLFPRATWSDDIVRDEQAYRRAWSPDWVSGACVVVSRDALEAIDGWDEGFFLYGEDVDLCRRLRDAGWDVRYDPSATARHLGGRSAPRSALLPVLAASRLRYAGKHRSRLFAFEMRIGIALGALTHVLLARGGSSARRGHLAALATALGRSTRPRVQQ